MARGIEFDCIKENQERRQINEALALIEKLIQEAKLLLEELKERLRKWRKLHEERRSQESATLTGRHGGGIGRIPIPHAGDDDRNGGRRAIQDIIKNMASLEQRTETIRKHRRHR